MKTLSKLYSRNSDGSIQTWEIQVDEGKHRVISGKIDGQKVTSDWTLCEGKNVGRSNETTPEEQSEAEAKAKFDKKKASGYWENIKDIDKSQYTEPMLAKKYKDVKFLFPVYTQPKLDGMRCIVRKDGMWSRGGKKIVSALHIYNALKHLFDKDPSLIFDGELFCNKYKNDFNSIISLAKQSKPTKDDLIASEQSLQYWIYDLASSEQTFGKRFDELKKILPTHKSIVIVTTDLVNNQDQLDAKYAEYLTEGQEGQIIRIDDIYENKRSKFLLKRKEFVDEEFKILEITEGKGNRSGMFGRARCITSKGVEFEANARGNEAFYVDLYKNKNKYIGEMATIRYQNMTPDGKPRFGVIVSIRNYE